MSTVVVSGSTHNISLSRGSLQSILDGVEVESATLQILGYKKVPGGGIERFRLLLNDGTLLFSFAILATQLNSLIKDGKLEKYTVFKLNKYACPLAQSDKKIILCLDITPLIPGSQINNQIDYLKTANEDNLVGLDMTISAPDTQPTDKFGLNTASPSVTRSVNQNQSSYVASPTTSSNSPVAITPVNQSRNTSAHIINPKASSPQTSNQRDYLKTVNNDNADGFSAAKASTEVQSADNLGSNTMKHVSVAKLGYQNAGVASSVISPVAITPANQSFTGRNTSFHEIKSTVSSISSVPVVTKSPFIPNSSKNQMSISNNAIVHSNWDRAAVSLQTSTQNKKSVVPIMSLTPYQNKWTIKARVIYKTSVTNYSNDKRSGKLFSFYLLDDSGEIKATAFDRDAGHLFLFLQLNKVYYISSATVRLPRSGPGIHDFELTVNPSTKIDPIDSDDSETPELKFKFIPINQISNWINNFIDVIGVCVGTEVRNIVIRSTNREVPKLDLQLIDMDGSKITVSIWGSDAESLNFNDFPVVAFKRVKVTDFNGCSLSMAQSSLFFINPNVTETNLLRAWFNEHVSSLQLDNLTNTFDRSLVWKSIADISNLDISNANVTDYSTVKATIVMVQKDNAMYQACPSNDCFKKVVATPVGQYHCNKCNKDFDSFSWTLMLKINLADFSSDLWTVAFRETAESILKLKTTDLSMMKEQNEEKFLETLSNLNFKSFIFKLRSKSEVFNDTNQLRVSILDAKPVDSVSYTKRLLSDINRFEKILNNDS